MSTPDPPQADTDAKGRPLLGAPWYDFALYWDEHPLAVDAATRQFPGWVRPYNLGKQSSYSVAEVIVAQSAYALARPSEGDGLRERAFRVATKIGVSLGVTEWAAGYVGMPLLAAHITARSIQLAMADAEDEAGSEAAEALIRTLWPARDSAEHPSNESVRAALALRRHAVRFGWWDRLPGMQELIRAGSQQDPPGYRVYAACLHRLLRAPVYGPGVDEQREIRGRAFLAVCLDI